MLIIKKYYDYYDTAMGIDGIDKTCVYSRIPKLVPANKMFEGEKVNWSRGPYYYDAERYRFNRPPKGEPYLIMPFVIGFCGKTYVGYLFRWEKPFQPMLGSTEYTQEIVYDIEDFFKYKQFNKRGKFSSGKQDEDIVTKYYTKFHNKPHQKLFVEHHTPIFVMDFGTNLMNLDVEYKEPGYYWNRPFLMINPILKDYQFYQIMNAAQTFQEIQMYLQGVLGNKEKEIVEISEKDKLLQHGFDPKWSFRNPCPPNRKKGKSKCNEVQGY